MNIKELVNKYVSKGFSLRNAQNIVAEEIMINKIASSEMAERVTIKGGLVMYNLSKSDRRVTKDIDFDFIKYSIDKESVYFFIDKMNSLHDGLEVSIVGAIEDLNQEDYQGVRVNTIIKDKFNNKLSLKLDIGVHSYPAIEQDIMIFNFDLDNNGVSISANPPEQIFAEKLISLGRHGVISTRYKDIYDLYYLIKKCNLSLKKVDYILELFLNNSSRKPSNISELQNIVIDTLNNKQFALEASKPVSKWVDESFEDVKDTIVVFVDKL